MKQKFKLRPDNDGGIYILKHERWTMKFVANIQRKDFKDVDGGDIFSGLAYVGEKDEEETMFISMPQVRLLLLSLMIILCEPLFAGSLLGHHHNDLSWVW